MAREIKGRLFPLAGGLGVAPAQGPILLDKITVSALSKCLLQQKS